MRLQVLENGYRPLQRLLMWLMRLLSGGPVAGTVLVLSYRREIFGEHMAPCFQEGLRNAREWSMGEIELFAAFVSRLNACQY
jgi:hypothetical protein